MNTFSVNAIRGHWFALVLAGAGLAVGLGLTASWLHWLRESTEIEDHLRFTQQVERLQDDLVNRFNLPLYGLAGLRASLAASGGVMTRTSFREYVGARDIESEFPGVRGFAFVERIARSTIPAYESAERLGGAPNFTVRTGGTAPDVFVIRYIEPLNRNAEALGFDLGSETVRREAVERAVDSGKPTLTAPIVLLQDELRGPGFLYLVPLYRFGADPTTSEQRRRALMGLAYTPIVVAELLANAVEQHDGQVDFRLLAAPESRAPVVVFDSQRPLTATAGELPKPESAYADRLFSTELNLEMGQHLFQLQVATTSAFVRTSYDRAAWGVGLGGALLSCLLASVLWLLARGRERALALAEAMTTDLDRLAKVAQRTSNAVVITDSKRRITWVNDGFTRLCGYSLDEVRGKVPGHLLQSQNTDQGTVQNIRQTLEAGSGFRAELCNQRKDGRDYWVDVDVQPLRDASGQLSGYMAIETDITETRAVRMRLERLAREQEVMLDSELVGIVKLQDRVAVWCNAGIVRMFGYSTDDLIGASARQLYPDEASFTALGAAAYPVLRSGGTYRTQLQMRHRSGALLWIDLSGMMVSNAPEESMWLMVDITAMKQRQILMEQAALHDALTRLPNRTLLTDRLEQALELVKRQQQTLAVVYLDLDGFKAVNDTHGHDAGDAVLCAVAERLPLILRACDTVARLGGDEFVILLSPAGTPQEMEDLLRRVQQTVREPVTLNGGLQAKVNASMGLAWYPQDGDEAAVLLSVADQRMFDAKRAHRAAVTHRTNVRPFKRA